MRKLITILFIITTLTLAQDVVPKEQLGLEQLAKTHVNLMKQKAAIELQLKQIEFAYNYIIAMETQKDTTEVE